MLSFRPMAALLALALLPAVSGAADDVGALRAELQALKNEYGARVDALEARIQQLEGGARGAAPEPAAGSRSAAPGIRGRRLRVQSRDLADPGRQLHQHVAQSRRLEHRRVSRRAAAKSVPANAASISANPSSRSRPTSIRTFRAS